MKQPTTVSYTTLAKIVKELAKENNVGDYHKVMQRVRDSNPKALGILLETATRKGIIRDVKYVVPNISDPREINNAFCIAAENSHIDIMKYLLKIGANVSYSNDMPLSCAVANGHEEAVRLLLLRGANVHVNEDRLILTCCIAGDYPTVLMALIEAGIDVLTNYHQCLNICLSKHRIDSANIIIKNKNKSGTLPSQNWDVSDNSSDNESEMYVYDRSSDADTDTDSSEDDSIESNISPAFGGTWENGGILNSDDIVLVEDTAHADPILEDDDDDVDDVEDVNEATHN